MKAFYGDFKLGILGGGQLGRMLIQEAINLNISTCVLDPDEDAPCKNICDEFIVGSLTDFETVYNFGKTLDLLTIEIEKVNIEALERLENEGITVFPQPRVIKLIQDKGLQKQFFADHNIPTAAFRLVTKEQRIGDAGLAFPIFQKLRKDGYDGRGVVRINSPEEIENAFTQPSIIEECIDFEKEISVIVARNSNGETKTFPCVEMEFNAEANLVEFLISPASLSQELNDQAVNLAIQTAGYLNMTGILAVEMFLTKTGEILVNELAPRPHNSGHQSIEGNYTSQFAQHLRAIFNLPLGDTRCTGHAVMINLLGEKAFEGEAVYEDLNDVLAIPGVYVHLYGKKLTKPFRKMGHITIIDDNREKAIETARMVQRMIKVKSYTTG